MRLEELAVLEFMGSIRAFHDVGKQHLQRWIAVLPLECAWQWLSAGHAQAGARLVFHLVNFETQQRQLCG